MQGWGNLVNTAVIIGGLAWCGLAWVWVSRGAGGHSMRGWGNLVNTAVIIGGLSAMWVSMRA